MNIILFEENEIQIPLKKHDSRTTHLLKVLHKKIGDDFEAGILGGKIGNGQIEKINPDGSVIFSLNLNKDPPSRTPVRIAIGFPRPIQLRRILRDLSNLGIEAIDLIGTELGEKSYRDTNLLISGGAQTALIEGAIQARDTNIPQLSTYPNLKIWLEKKLWEEKESELIAADNISPQNSFFHYNFTKHYSVLAIGSERGWTDQERKLLENAGFQRLSLGKRSLRCETACIAATILAMENMYD